MEDLICKLINFIYWANDFDELEELIIQDKTNQKGRGYEVD